jgi:hypothetical protein
MAQAPMSLDNERMSRPPTWDGKVYRQMKFGDTSIKGTSKEAELKMRQRARRRDYEADRRALEAFYAYQNARLHGLYERSARSWTSSSEAIALPSETGKAISSQQ